MGIWLLSGAMTRTHTWLQIRAQAASLPLAAEAGRRPRYETIKRAIDFAASLCLLVLFAPLLLCLAILVKLDSPGPAFFRQVRIGQDGCEFLLWKFRSMRVDVKRYARSPTSADDPRITRLGRVLRRTSLDELPQLLNVLQGHMSLIGPRPEMPFLVARYTSIERTRLAVRPGMTGLWQISPCRVAPIHENLHCDLHYIQHRNLVFDAAILLRTLQVVIRGQGAV